MAAMEAMEMSDVIKTSDLDKAFKDEVLTEPVLIRACKHQGALLVGAPAGTGTGYREGKRHHQDERCTGCTSRPALHTEA